MTDSYKTFKPAVAIFSGGLDSTTLVYHMLAEGYQPHLLSFDYGQRHSKELKYAEATADRLNLRHDIINLTGLTHLISNSALTSKVAPGFEMNEIEVPEGHYAEENMKATVVPNRNMIMLSIAAGVAINEKAVTVGFGAHAGDHFIYPDCRPEFLFELGQAVWDGNEGFHSFEYNDLFCGVFFAPFIDKTKADIAYRALELGVPFENTWSCYKGGEIHCGKCGTCVERLEAISEATERFDWKKASEGEPSPDAPSWRMSWAPASYDRTEYEDDEYWRTAVAK